jgi:hypothetical protein
VTALVPGQRVGVRVHMMVCKACPRFTMQVTLTRRALNRWKAMWRGELDLAWATGQCLQ